MPRAGVILWGRFHIASVVAVSIKQAGNSRPTTHELLTKFDAQ